MKRFLIVVALSVILGLLMLAAGCSGGGNKNGKKISIAYANWAEGIAMTHLAKVALEDDQRREQHDQCQEEVHQLGQHRGDGQHLAREVDLFD